MILKRLYRTYGYVNQPLLLFRFRYISILVHLAITAKNSSRFLLSTFFYFVALPRVHLDYRILCKWIYVRVSSCKFVSTSHRVKLEIRTLHTCRHAYEFIFDDETTNGFNCRPGPRRNRRKSCRILRFFFASLSHGEAAPISVSTLSIV